MKRPRTLPTRALSEPASVVEAEAEFDQLYAEIADIESQLAARPQPHQRVAADEFAAWRTWHGQAVAALRGKQARYTFLKKWLHRQREPSDTGRSARPAGQPSQRDLLARLILVLEEVIGGKADDLSPPARTALAELRAWQQTWTEGDLH